MKTETKKTDYLQRVKDFFNTEKPTEEEIRVSKMMSVLFQEQSTEQVIDTLLLFEEKVKTRLKEINRQADTDRFITEFYLETSPKKVTI